MVCIICGVAHATCRATPHDPEKDEILMATQTWTADRRVYLDAQGRAVEATDPTRRTLLIRQGGQIPLAQAAALGLISADPPADPQPSDPPTTAGKPAPANKARPRPAADKAPTEPRPADPPPADKAPQE